MNSATSTFTDCRLTFELCTAPLLFKVWLKNCIKVNTGFLSVSNVSFYIACLYCGFILRFYIAVLDCFFYRFQH